jgi:hypothetical protein
LAYVPSAIEPHEPFGFSRYYTALSGQGVHAPLPKIKVAANLPGRYTIKYLLRNARQSRVVGTSFVEVGMWRGIWKYTETRDLYTPGAGSIWCCSSSPNHTGSGCGQRTTGAVSYTSLEPGGDLAPRPIKAGVQRLGDREGCFTGSITEPPDAEAFSLKAVNYFGISSGAGGYQYDAPCSARASTRGCPTAAGTTARRSRCRFKARARAFPIGIAFEVPGRAAPPPSVGGHALGLGRDSAARRRRRGGEGGGRRLAPRTRAPAARHLPPAAPTALRPIRADRRSFGA